MSPYISKKEAKKMGARLAAMHNRPLLPDLRGVTFLNGQYLYEKSRLFNMTCHLEIKEAVKKMDAIVQQVTGSLPHPFVMLWNGCDENTAPGKYGNPAWDLGIVINGHGGDNHSEAFLRQYLRHQGVPVTIIELYTGILYAKLRETLITRNEESWRHLAKNECAGVIQGKRLAFKEISAEMFSRLGLSGLNRGVIL